MSTNYQGNPANITAGSRAQVTEPSDGDADNGATFQAAYQGETDFAEYLSQQIGLLGYLNPSIVSLVASSVANAFAHNGIAGSNGLWVCVGNNGGASAEIQTSVDGVSWTARTIAGTSTNFYAAAYSSDLSLWCVVGAGSSGNNINTSPDGVTWTARTSGTGNTLRGITWSHAKSLWCAVGDSGTIITSPDGITWTSRTSGTANSIQGVTWVASLGLFIAVCNQANGVLTSPDGITWTARSTPTTPANTSTSIGIAYTTWSGLVAFSDNNATSKVLTSPDGITWTARSTTLTGVVNTNLGTNGRFFVAVPSAGGGQVSTSFDGINWTTRAPYVGSGGSYAGYAFGANPITGQTLVATGSSKAQLSLAMPVN